MTYRKCNLLSWVVFIPTLVLVIILNVFTVFPAIGSVILSNTRFPINAFELGTYAIPLAITNGIIFTLMELHYKKRLPNSMLSAVSFILKFEVPKNLTLFILIIMIGGYAVFTVGEVWQTDPWEDYERTVRPSLESWSTNDPFSVKTLVYFLGNSSLAIFGTYRAIPFLSSLGLLVLTYLLAVELSKKRFSGLIAVVLTIQSSNFLTYDTTITYPNFWSMFYLLSLYMIFKKWPISIAAGITSVFAKILAFGFIPFSIAFAMLSDIPIRRKIQIVVLYVVISLGIIIIYILNVRIFNPTMFSHADFVFSMTILPTQFRYDFVLILFLLPVIFCLFIKARNNIPNASAITVLIFGTFLLGLFIPALTTYTNSPYRFVPLSIFFAIGVGMIFARKTTIQA